MKLLFSLTYYTPYVSGLTLYVKRLAEELAKKKGDVTVLCMQHDVRLPNIESRNNVLICRASVLFQISKGFFSVDWLSKSWREVVGADVVIVNLPQMEAIIPAFFAKLLGKRLIAIYHCEIHLPRTLFNQLVELSLFTIHWIILTFTDRVVTYTRDFADSSTILPKFQKKLHYIYPPITVPKIEKRIQKTLMEKINKKPDILIGIAARLAAEKGIEYLLEAIPYIKSKVKSQKLIVVIAGSMNPVGEESYRKKIMQLVEKYKEFVVFLGEIAPEDMGSFYSILDVLVLPSVNSTEAFGMVQVEAMMMKAPVVATNLPGIRVPIQITGMGKLVPPRNSKALAEAIVEVIQNPSYKTSRVDLFKEFSLENTIRYFYNL